MRTLAFSAVFNFRDLGGYPGADGRTVRWRRLFRSDSLSRLTDTDREAFAALGVRTVVDLRRPYEVARDGRVPDWEGLLWRHIHPDHPEWDHDLWDERAGVARYLADRYAELADIGAAGLGGALGVLANSATAPAVVHCVAGKDRTGVVCALTLALLGVADDDIAADYALTREAEPRFAAWLREAYPELAASTPPPYFTQTPPEAMLLFLRELRARHGSIERYAAAAGVTAGQIESLRTNLLD
ncbi:MAG TPA: tyrosine-protein phosphatase [Micromonosporaceae bacterium]|jgi:protein-tyrosine phosphatase|nr:tyrosine-protein phosphatase [Micromonosporaceae bacterium]